MRKSNLESTTRERILSFIKVTIDERGYPPSLREIGHAVGLSSPATVQYHLRRLEDEGKLRRDPLRSRAMSIGTGMESEFELGSTPAPKAGNYLPIVASVGAGMSVISHETEHDYLAVPDILSRDDSDFILRVRGDSMIDIGIYDQDLVVVHPQPDANDSELIVANVENELGTLKILRKRGNRIYLEARNHQDPQWAQPLDVTGRVEIVGKVIGLMRIIS
jgi:repressor LexA